MSTQRPFSRLAIVNRGEAAMRLVHAARELNEEHKRHFHLIALYTEPEAQAMFVRRSDEGYGSGPSPADVGWQKAYGKAPGIIETHEGRQIIPFP